MQSHSRPRRFRSALLLGAVTVVAVAAGLACASAAQAVAPADVLLPPVPTEESEPNDTTANADPIASGERVRGRIMPGNDVDVYSFQANSGDTVYAALMTAGSSGASDSQLRLIDPSDVEIEVDSDDGTMGSQSSTIAGAQIETDGTHTLEVTHDTGAAQIRPYHLYLEVRDGSPAPEAEPNDSTANANPLSDGHASGVLNPAGEQDHFAIELNAGDTVFLSLDLNPERDATNWDGRLGFGLLGDAGDQITVVDSKGVPSPTNPLSEAMFATVDKSGTYYVVVDGGDPGVGGPTATYRLSAAVIAAAPSSCRTYATTAPGHIGDLGATTFTIPVADPAIIDRAAIRLDLIHTLMGNLDATLRSPAGNENGLFTDIGANVVGGQQHMEVVFDDSAAHPPFSPVLRPLMLQPESNHRMGWFEGEQAQGDWEFVLYDDSPVDTGTLMRAELILCERPAPPPQSVVFEADFEDGDDEFIHSGAADEWERGTPATTAPFAPLSSCAVGSGCFKTDLDGGYDAFSDQELVSPLIDLTDQSGRITARWKQWLSMESATFDRYAVTVEEEGEENARFLYQWDGSSMTTAVGNPAVTVPGSAGWGELNADISEYAGKKIRFRFNLVSDSSVQYGGVAIDDVRVTQRADAFPVSVTTAGSGSGFVDSAPAGIDCGLEQAAKTACSSDFPDGTEVTLTAHPDEGTSFEGFSGAGCSGSGTECVVTVDEVREITATFARIDPDCEPGHEALAGAEGKLAKAVEASKKAKKKVKKAKKKVKKAKPGKAKKKAKKKLKKAKKKNKQANKRVKAAKGEVASAQAALDACLAGD